MPKKVTFHEALAHGQGWPLGSGRAARRRALGLGVLLATFGACGDPAHRMDASASSEAGICGTHAEPGILTLANLSPAKGSTVTNQSIVHGFTVVAAPAEFNNFELRFGPSHTAGLPTPDKPRFAMTPMEGDIIYQLTIDAWSHAPAHVELLASGGYDTMQGCTWDFPSPLFSYDVIPGGDSGLADARLPALDGPPGVLIKLDAPMKFDLASDEAGRRLDGGGSAEAGGDLQALDAAIDSPLGAIDAEID